jgi:hypothetical protein
LANNTTSASINYQGDVILQTSHWMISIIIIVAEYPTLFLGCLRASIVQSAMIWVKFYCLVLDVYQLMLLWPERSIYVGFARLITI